MKLLTAILDRFQATFPPNRIMLILAGPITAAAIWLTAWVTAHVPGVNLPVGIVAGAIGAVALITITLLYKWFDQWQKGEPIAFNPDIEQALTEFETKGFYSAVGTMHALFDVIEGMRQKLDHGIPYKDLESELGHISKMLGGFLAEHSVETVPAAPVASPAPVAAPPAAPEPSAPVE